MENQTRYDLNAAIESWRQELAVQASLTAEVRRELETHLRDAITGFRQRGLNDEESFWLARRRVGQPPQIAEEFTKANPATVWRERIFWTAVILLAIRLWSGISLAVWAIYRTIATPYVLNNYHFVSPFPDWIRFYLPLPSNIDLFTLLFSPSSQMVFNFLSLLPVVGIALLLSRGRLSQSFSWMQFFFRSRRRFLFISATLFLFYFLLLVNSFLRYPNEPNNPSLSLVITMNFIGLFYPGILVGLIAWLLPPQNQKTPKRA
jgi:hypothetical protein